MNLTRNCPVCNTPITYKRKGDRQQAEKHNTKCKRCSQVPRIETIRASMTGENNHFFGKKHTEQTKDLLRQKQLRRVFTEQEKQQARDQLAKVANSKHPFKIWKEKLSLPDYEVRVAEFRQKQSRASSGVNNPMYGRPAPLGSGVGWSGWFKGSYFRSLRELSFMVSHNGWESAERKIYRATYILDGVERTCYADFVLDDTLIEIKPIQLQGIEINTLKAVALTKLATERGLKFLILDPPLISSHDLHLQLLAGTVKFLDKYQQRAEVYANSRN